MLSQYMANKCKSTRSTYFNSLGLRLSHGLMLNSVEIITPNRYQNRSSQWKL